MSSPSYALLTSGRLSTTVATPRGSISQRTGPTELLELIARLRIALRSMRATALGHIFNERKPKTKSLPLNDTLRRRNQSSLSMAISEWRAARNERSRARLHKALPSIFPGQVLGHALSRPFIPPTPRLAIDRYWRAHPIRADRLARALAARSGAPEGWCWRLRND